MCINETRNMQGFLLRSVYAAVLLIGIILWMPSSAMADALDDDLDAQWTTRRIPAQTGERVFTTARRFEIALGIGVVPTDDYFTYFPVVLDIDYRFTEMWGLMLRGSLLMAHADSALSDFMDASQSGISAKMLSDEQLGDISVMASFHPVYGKWTVGTSNLSRFDWGIFAGVGVVFSESSGKSYSKRSFGAHAEGILGMDAHIFFLDWIALRLEASFRFYKAPTRWIVPGTLSVGVSFFLPAIWGGVR